MISDFKSRYLGDRAFHRMVLRIAVPVMIQNGITNFVSLLDNIMVGQVGTEPMSGVAIVNQLIFVFNLCIFGGLAGAGIFTAQFYGQGDQEGIRQTFRYKLWIGFLLCAAAFAVFLTAGGPLISLYLNESAEGGDLVSTLGYGKSYLSIMLAGLPAFMLAQVYASSLRECGETLVPMRAGIIAVLVNLAGNWLLIYGHLGLPRLGVDGAAIATVLSRYVEMTIVILWTHLHKEKNPWVSGLFRTMRIPFSRTKEFFRKGFPLLINEALWSSGIAALSQCYSVRGLNVVTAQNISSTITNLFNVVFLSMGTAIAIILGQRLGANRLDEARDSARKLIVMSILMSAATGLLLICAAPFFPRFYQTGDDIRALATRLMIVNAVFMPMNAFANACYFTLRSGGKTWITFLFDSVCLWTLCIPVAFILSRYTDMYIVWMLVCVNCAELIKCALGFHLVRKGVWVRNIVSGNP